MVQTNVKPPLLVLTGPTATGKTGVSLALARHLPIEIVNCDASQVYSDMTIGTAAPTTDELAQARHHMFGIVSPDDPMDAGRYKDMATDHIHEILQRGSIPLLVGGTGLYIRAMTRGLASIPRVPQEVRTALEEEMKISGLESLRAKLATLDPDAHARISTNDPQRTLRALEVVIHTGIPISVFQAEHAFGQQPYNHHIFGLDLPDEILRPRMRLRIESMVASGLLHEAENLRSRYPEDLRAFKALGYRDAFAHLDGQISSAELVDRLFALHVQYSRRQRTWFRKEPGISWYHPSSADEICAQAASWLKGLSLSAS